MKSKAKFKWLTKALDGVKDGSQKINPIFEIFKHKQFVEGLSNSDGRRALYMIKSSMECMTQSTLYSCLLLPPPTSCPSFTLHLPPLTPAPTPP